VSDSTTPAAGLAGPSLNDFASFYLYGLSTNPYQQTTDFKSLGNLYNLVIGGHGGFSIASTFHPYQLVNPAGVTVWYAAYAQFYAQPTRIEMFGEMTLEQAQFVITPPASFADYHVWPDTRLTTDANPIFGKYVPFVLPFLVRKAPNALRWDAEMSAAAGDRERMGWYLEAVNDAIKFLQPSPALVLGFDEFDEQRPARMVERFLSCRDLLR
jgi:hypothetical protein